MYPRAFRYHRAGSLQEAVTMLSELGEEAKILAGGQSLIPLMKLRFASPRHLVDLNFVPGLSYVEQGQDELRFGPLTRHAEIEHSQEASQIPLLHDCATGIADVQVRNRGTIGGSLAEAEVPRLAAYASVVLLGVVGPLTSLITPGAAALPTAVLNDSFFGPARLLPLDWLTGALLGVPVGLTWAGSMLDRRE